MNIIRFRKSASGICSNPSGITDNSLTRSEAMSDLEIISSFGPADSNRTRTSVFSTMRPLRLRPSFVSTRTFS